MRKFLSTTYHRLVETHPEEMERRFPLRAYGVKKGSEQYKKMFPHDFKKYFFDVLSNMKKNREGDLIRPKSVRRTFFLPSGAVGSVPN